MNNNNNNKSNNNKSNNNKRVNSTRMPLNTDNSKTRNVAVEDEDIAALSKRMEEHVNRKMMTDEVEWPSLGTSSSVKNNRKKKGSNNNEEAWPRLSKR